MEDVGEGVGEGVGEDTPGEGGGEGLVEDVGEDGGDDAGAGGGEGLVADEGEEVGEGVGEVVEEGMHGSGKNSTETPCIAVRPTVKVFGACGWRETAVDNGKNGIGTRDLAEAQSEGATCIGWRPLL